MTVTKRGPGRPPTLTVEQRKEQLRAGTAAHRQRMSGSGKVRMEVSVDSRTKAAVEAYRDQHGLTNLGEALDAIILNNVDR